jgi:CUG-BP- and ETR3-like factor
MALAAICGLKGISTMRGCDQPLIVRFDDRKRPRQKAAGFDLRLDTSNTRLPSNNSDPMGDCVPPS